MGNGAILTIGDSMMDIDVTGKSSRISPEAPIPIIDINEDAENKRLGGAANIALQITAIDIPSIFAYKSYIGPRPCHDNEEAREHENMSKMLRKNKVRSCKLDFKKCHPVTKKTRIWSNNQQVCRIDFENKEKPNIELQIEWYKQIVGTIQSSNVKVVIFSDYDKGTLVNNLIQLIINFCHDMSIPTILDPKRPNFYKLRNLTVVKPNAAEMHSTGFTAEECSRFMGDTWIVNTLGPNGIALYQHGDKIFDCPTEASSVVNVVSAGDAVAAVLAIGMYKNKTIKQSAIAANKSASYVVKKKGSYILNKNEIQECFHGAQKSLA